MQVAMAAGHAGFELKQRIVEWLNANGSAALDLGTDSSKPVDYPSFAELRRDQQQWIASARKSAEPSVEQPVGVPRKAGIPLRNIFFGNSRVRRNRVMLPELYLSTRKRRTATPSLLATKPIAGFARSRALT